MVRYTYHLRVTTNGKFNSKQPFFLLTCSLYHSSDLRQRHLGISFTNYNPQPMIYTTVWLCLVATQGERRHVMTLKARRKIKMLDHGILRNYVKSGIAVLFLDVSSPAFSLVGTHILRFHDLFLPHSPHPDPQTTDGGASLSGVFTQS